MRTAARLVLICLVAAGCAGPRLAETGPKPRPVSAPTPEAVRAAVRRGERFLVASQNTNGSWGSARDKGFEVLMPVPAGHGAARAAVTALCVSALIESGSDDPAVAAAIRRGEDWLLAHLAKLRLSSPNIMYNNWAHAFGLQALVRMLGHMPPDDPRRPAVRKLIRGQVDWLARHQHADGGWGYYAFRTKSARPVADSNSFMTATVLIALHEAREAGSAVPGKVVRHAMDSIRRQRAPDFSYAYWLSAIPVPQVALNQKPGSLARSQACNAAMRLWGDPKTTPAVIRAWLDRLCARHGWLSMTRKTTYPHEGYYAIAGYFYYYGFYYAGACIELAPAADRPRLAGHVAHLLLARQEKDGAWWDFPLYNYHQPYGTSFAMMALAQCLDPLEPKPHPTLSQTPSTGSDHPETP